MSTSKAKPRVKPQPKHIAVVGAGIAGIACARTLVQAGHLVTVFEKSRGIGGRMATRDSEFGTFDLGTQYFTVRDPRFARALKTTPDVCKPWSANTVRVLDPLGRVAEAGRPGHEAHWVPAPGMNALPKRWAEPLMEQHKVELETKVVHVERDALNPRRWQLHTEGPNGEQHVFSDFDAVLLAMPSVQAHELLQTSQLADKLVQQIEKVVVAPCWTLMLAFPQAVQPGLITLGPQWNAARSTHHRIAWLARESSKPGRSLVERWTVQASIAWSQEHLDDDALRVQAKLLKAFAEVTGIRAEPDYVDTQRWRYAQTTQPLGKSHLWDAKAGIGVCGDWCLGHRVEDAFISGLELALAVA
jgi:renalase